MPSFRKDLTPEKVEAVIANLDAGLVAQLERFIGKPDDQLRINLLRAMTPPFLRAFTEELRSRPDSIEAFAPAIMSVLGQMACQVLVNCGSPDQMERVIDKFHDLGPKHLSKAGIMALSAKAKVYPKGAEVIYDDAGEPIGFSNIPSAKKEGDANG